MTSRFKCKTAGKAMTANIVGGNCYRITVLTPSLMRLEYDESGLFEDRATQKVFFRDLPAVSFIQAVSNGVLTVETDKLILTYEENRPFCEKFLSIRLKDIPYTTWIPGHEQEQLKGTFCTLDQTDGEIPLDDGVCSRNGYALVDDSNTTVLTDEGWFDLRKGSATDWYFFGYGHDYQGAVRDLFRITGAPPMLPDYALGNWWSRYYKYTQDEYQNLMQRFDDEDVPFSVAVVDMDWHYVDETPDEGYNHDDPRGPVKRGWTGWSWNPKYFPDYKGFLKFIKDHNLVTSLNLHPAHGIGCHEVQYPAFCKALGLDPADKKLIKLDLLNPKFMELYFDLIMHPFEEEGVGFWWMDWQQGTNYWWIHDEEHPASPLEKMTPLWLLNHLHIQDIARTGKRPMFFSRYCDLGSQRYPVGFSGDTAITWECLNFQPYFTANSTNAGYPWWSHDIGGHHNGYKDDELTLRWMQFGLFAPINRLHSTDNNFNSKEPWNLSPYSEQISKNILRLRNRLFPYLYTMNYRCSYDLIALIQPLYYLFPENEAAYHFPNEYFFGSELLVAPITEKSDPVSLHGKTRMWFPEGTWTDIFTGFVYKGGRELTVCRPIEQYPVFAKAGGILPTQDHDPSHKLGNSENMTVYVFPGADNSFSMYEDEGDGSRYLDGVCARTEFSFKYGTTSTFTVSAPNGDTSFLPKSRNWTVIFRGFKKGVKISASAPIVSSHYDEKTSSYVVKFAAVPLTESFTVTLESEGLPVSDNSYMMPHLFDVFLHAQMPNDFKQDAWAKFVECPTRQMDRNIPDKTYYGLYCVVREMQDITGGVEYTWK